MDSKQERLLAKLNAANNAHKVYKKNVLFRSLSTILAFILGFLLTAYGAMYVIRQNTQFTIKIPELTPQINLSLSETIGFENPTARIQYDTKNTVLDNIDGRYDLPDGLENVDGDHSGNNYLAFTFYLQNVGTEEAQVTASIDITKVVLGADEAMRIRLYVNGEYQTLAKQAKDGNPEPDSVEFFDDSTPYKNIFRINPKEINKYTIVIWLEGNDPECINDILGGFVRLEMNFSAERVPTNIN